MPVPTAPMETTPSHQTLDRSVRATMARLGISTIPGCCRNWCGTGSPGAIHATIDLAGVMLPDSAHIQDTEVEQFNRRAAHRHRDRVEPIHDANNLAACLALFRPPDLGDWFGVIPGLRARFGAITSKAVNGR